MDDVLRLRGIMNIMPSPWSDSAELVLDIIADNCERLSFSQKFLIYGIDSKKLITQADNSNDLLVFQISSPIRTGISVVEQV